MVQKNQQNPTFKIHLRLYSHFEMFVSTRQNYTPTAPFQ